MFEIPPTSLGKDVADQEDQKDHAESLAMMDQWAQVVLMALLEHPVLADHPVDWALPVFRDLLAYRDNRDQRDQLAKLACLDHLAKKVLLARLALPENKGLTDHEVIPVDLVGPVDLEALVDEAIPVRRVLKGRQANPALPESELTVPNTTLSSRFY